jgi:hypothetical protein
MKTTHTTLGTMFGKTLGMPMVILAITGTVMAGTVAGAARAARAMGPMSDSCQAEHSGPSLKELISTLKGQSAAPRSEAKASSAGAKEAGAKVATVTGRSGAGTKVSAAKTGGRSMSAPAGTPVATKKAVAKAEPASMKKAAKKKSASTTAAAKKAATTKKSAAGARPRSSAM